MHRYFIKDLNIASKFLFQYFVDPDKATNTYFKGYSVTVYSEYSLSRRILTNYLLHYIKKTMTFRHKTDNNL